MSTTASKLWFFLIIGLLAVTFKSAEGATTFSLLKKRPDSDCQPVKRDLLRQRLGNAYNKRYMAMDDTDLQHKTNQSPLGDQEHVTKPKNVTKRSVEHADPSAWTCQTTYVWRDLGAKFFPRHLRTVTCSSDNCWFEHFRCRPKHYAIQVLKKKVGECLRVYSSTGHPRFEDFWEAVEFEITVDCECGHR